MTEQKAKSLESCGGDVFERSELLLMNLCLVPPGDLSTSRRENTASAEESS